MNLLFQLEDILLSAKKAPTFTPVTPPSEKFVLCRKETKLGCTLFTVYNKNKLACRMDS